SADKILIYSLDGEIPEGPTEISLGAKEFGESSNYLPPYVVSSLFEADSGEFGWRSTLIYSLIFPIAVFLLILIVLVIVIKLVSGRHFSLVPMIVCSLLIVSFIAEELFFWLYKSNLPRNMSKAAIGLILVLFAGWGLLKWRKAKVLFTADGKYFMVIASCVLLFAVADLVIDASVAVGLALFAFVHVVIASVNLYRRRLSPYQWLAWAAMTVVLGFIIIFIVNISNTLKLLFTIYAAVVSMLVVSSHNNPTLVSVGSGLLMLSDCMMGFYHSINDVLLLHSVYNLIYYAAMFSFAYACFRHKDISREKKALKAEAEKTEVDAASVT
ncbi:MAG: hypothetical protein ILP16_02195, partial [Spirochaetales bacterium]|nr:hypothetical protein [Spirochaetales bacterium]